MGNSISKFCGQAIPLASNVPLSTGLKAHSVRHVVGIPMPIGPIQNSSIPGGPTPTAAITHSDLPASRTSASINPELKKITMGGKHQYMLGGEKFGEPYLTKDALRTIGAPINAHKVFVGQGFFNKVRQRRNPDSPFYVKKSRLNVCPTVREYSMAVTNEIAKSVNDDELLKRHFIVEVVKKVEEQRITFLTPAVNGFTLDRYCTDRSLHAKWPPRKLAGKFENLKSAIRILAERGFVHNDTHDGNVMFNEETEELVLVDFEYALRYIEDDASSRAALTDCLNDIAELEGFVLSEYRDASMPISKVRNG